MTEAPSHCGFCDNRQPRDGLNMDLLNKAKAGPLNVPGPCYLCIYPPQKLAEQFSPLWGYHCPVLSENTLNQVIGWNDPFFELKASTKLADIFNTYRQNTSVK